MNIKSSILSNNQTMVDDILPTVEHSPIDVADENEDDVDVDVDDVDCGEIGDDYRISLKNSHKFTRHVTEKFVYKTVKLTLFVYMIDLFDMYKLTNVNNVNRKLKINLTEQKYRFFLLPILNCEDDFYDKLRNKFWRPLFINWNLYIIVKFSIATFYQIFCYRISSIYPTTFNKTINYDQTKEDLLFTNKINSSEYIYHYIKDFFSNPLSQVPSVSILFYSGGAVSLFVGVYLFTYHNDIKLVDSPHTRLFLVPELELKRIDLILNEKLNCLHNLFKSKTYKSKEYYYNKHYGIINRHNSRLQYKELYNFHESKMATYLLTILKRIKYKYWLLRPAIYQPERYDQLTFVIFIVVVGITMLFIIPILILPYELYIGAVRSRCESLYGSAYLSNKINIDRYCGIKNFTWFEIIMMFESMTAMIAIAYMFVVQMVFMSGVIITETIDVNDLQEDLLGCLKDLRMCNMYLLEHDNNNELNYYDSLELVLMAERHNLNVDFLGSQKAVKSIQDNKKHLISYKNNYTNKKSSYHHTYQYYHKKLFYQLDITLLRTLIKLKVVDEDSRTNNKLIAKFMTSFLIIISYIMIINLIGGRLDGADLQLVRQPLLVWTLFMSNFVLLICSYQSKAIEKLDPFIWSILAQLMIKSIKQRRHVWNEYIGNGWLKLAHSCLFSKSTNSIKFLNLISISYKRTLSMNFVLLSIASILKTW